MKDFSGKVVIVTGGASGIGFALAERFTREGARVVLSDWNDAGAKEKARLIGALPITTNVGVEAEIARLVDITLNRYSHIDLFVSNAGIAYPADIDTPAEKWREIYDVNVQAHVNAAKYALPAMLARGEGYFLNTSCAAGLLVEFDALTYTVSKHAAVGFAEWLGVNYHSRGIRVSVLAPAGVRTPMIADNPDLMSRAIDVEEVAERVIAGLAEERFLISTHRFVDELFLLKAQNYDTYMRVMETRRDTAESLNARAVLDF